MKKKWALFTRLFFLIPFLFILSCAAIDVPPNNVSGIIYVLDDFSDAVYVFDNATTINGAVGPNRTITGTTNTGISNPTVLIVDGVRDILYVADSTLGNILAFNPASQINGDTAPLRKYPGVTKAGDMFYDDVNDRLYVTDISNLLIKVWDKVGTLPDGTAATRSIKLGFIPNGMVVDRQRDLLYVGNSATQSVNVYDKPSTLSSNIDIPVLRSFTNTTKPLISLGHLAINVPNNFLFVSDTSTFNTLPDNLGPSIEIFHNASTLNGAVPATSELTGTNTGFTIDTRNLLFLENVLYVTLDNTHIGIWNNANALSGNTTPDRTLQISPATHVISFGVDLAH